MRRARNIALASVAIVPTAILLWIWLGPKPSLYYTDGLTLRQEAGEATTRTVLWAPPELLASAMNEDADSFDPCFSADGRTLIFVRGRPKENADLFVMRRESAGWSAPEPLESINIPDADELGPELSHDGSALYFSSDRPGGEGGYDIWIARKQADGAWGTPHNPGPSVNSPFHEYDPALSPGGDRLFFSSNRILEANGDPAWRATLRGNLRGKDFDIFAANAEAGGDGFAPAERLKALSSPADEGQVAVTARGEFLYFSSDREGGEGGFDLYRSRWMHGEMAAPANLGKPINTAGDEMDPTLWMEGFGLAFSSNRESDAENDAYALFRSVTREVESVEETHWLWNFLGRYKWLLLGALAALALALWLIRRYFGEGATLMQRCVAGSVVAHLVLLVLFAFWKFAEEILILQKQTMMEIATDSDNLAEEMLALDIRESVSQLPPVRIRPEPAFASPPPPDFQAPDPVPLPPTPSDQPATATPAFHVDAELPPEEPTPSPTPDFEPSTPDLTPDPLAFDLAAVQLETRDPPSELQPETPLEPLDDPSKTAEKARRATRPIEADSSQPVASRAREMAPSQLGETSSALTASTAETGDVAPPSSPAPEVSTSLSADALNGLDVDSEAIQLEAAPTSPVPPSRNPAPTSPSPAGPSARKTTVAMAADGEPRMATSATDPTAAVPNRPSNVAPVPGEAAAPVPVTHLESLDASEILGRDDLDLGDTIVLEAPVDLVDPYLLRNPEIRKRVLDHIGGSKETELAIQSALDWFTRHQEPDGRWDIRRFGGRQGHDVACTGLAMLCYMGWGATHTKDTPHRETFRKALDWLLAQINDEDGDARGKGGDMYDHGIAAIALAECYGMTKDKAVRAKLEKAIDFVVKAQSSKSGGWRYKPGEHGSDTSVVGWQVLALRSARMAGLDVPASSFEGARRWLDHVGGGPSKGLYGYQNRHPKPAMVAEGMFCQQLLDVPRDHPRMIESAKYLNTALPKAKGTNYYYWYYGALALHQHQGEIWEVWDAQLRSILLSSQAKTGNDAGSWKPEGQHGNDAGRAVVTAMATLTLEVHFRYLPMYGGQ